MPDENVPETAAEKKKRYQREYYRRNKERLSAQNSAWYAENREKENARRRQWHADHREEAKDKMHQWYAGHREEELPKHRKWHKENRDSANASRRVHHHAHKDEANEGRKRNAQMSRLKTPWKQLIKSAADRAAKKNLTFSLTEEWAETRWTGFCELTGIEFRLGQRTSGPKFYSPSLDRISPAEGYTPSNCRFVLWAINSFKHDGTDDDMLLVAQALLSKHSPK